MDGTGPQMTAVRGPRALPEPSFRALRPEGCEGVP